MQFSDFANWKQNVQLISMVCSVILNSILIFLLYTRSPRKMGSYKYLMYYFSIFAIFLSSMDFLVQPYIHSYKSCIIMATVTRDSYLTKFQLVVAICILCGCFGIIISLIAIHFIFRCFALERKGKLAYFNGINILYWFAIPIIIGMFWGYIVYISCGPSDEASQYFGDNFRETFGLNVTEIAYISAYYWRKDSNGVERLSWFTVNCLFLLSLTMVVSLGIMFYYGMKSLKLIKLLVLRGKSSYTKNLQRQLYKALVAQALIPIFILYIPVGLYMLFPAFEIELGLFTKFITVAYAIYPAIDPLPSMFIVEDFRYAICDVFNICGMRSNKVAPRTEQEINSISRSILA